ncbi:hypothetical protein L4G92_05745 [Neisseria sp. ZJ106]|uniref:Uncharacterized protein n=1 Tax=Neisseria lisongii TaxID=2912188 RepID=A0ABY7RHC7_9NEIS|nr:hypothetical protein [Neisseria lisongii]MCF7521549.1 hypothetical protein [Neisseria lisongii]WCL71024.1 hypothetical protein PJU73_06590 [Neisseria lisongii]
MSINNYNKIIPFKSNNKEKELKTAVKFQRRLIPSKFAYFYTGFLGLLTFLQKCSIIHIANFDELMSWLGLLFAVLTVYSVISTFFLTICPYCHRFQNLFNGKSVNGDTEGISYSQGMVPFIHHCNRCNAPLSPKAVIEHYKKQA